jgi:hypothetical protein
MLQRPIKREPWAYFWDFMLANIFKLGSSEILLPCACITYVDGLQITAEAM